VSAADRELIELPSTGWDPQLRVFRSRDGEVDSFALLTRRFVVLVDTTSLPQLAARIVERLRSELAGRRLLVVNTHADYDHAWGNATFAAGGPFPAPLLGHDLARERMQSQPERDRLARMQAADPAFAGVRLVPPALTFSERLTIQDDDLRVELLHTPGHTVDHVAVWVPELRLLLAGDAAEHPFPEAGGAAGVPLLRGSLARLAALDPALVFPCHGGTTDPGLLARNRAYFDTLERHARQAMAAGVLPADRRELDARLAELPDLIDFPFEAALRLAGANPAATPGFYRDFHRANARAVILAYVVQA
jgi:glyoxylase-like metal-dependent hydrolase (beta-lactamase superfamily II)